MPSRVVIPKPCPVSARALSPTEAGWHCARCQTEVIDFTRLSEDEILAYLTEHRGQRVCAAMRMPLVPQHYKRPRGSRRWLLAVAAFLGWQLAEASPPQPPSAPLLQLRTAAKERITIRGVVLDDSLNVPVAGACIFIAGTKYGAITNEKGEFSFSFASDWKLATKGSFLLEVSAGHFTFKRQLATVSFLNDPVPAPLTVRLQSLPERGYIMGKILLAPPPVPPPGSRKS